MEGTQVGVRREGERYGSGRSMPTPAAGTHAPAAASAASPVAVELFDAPSLTGHCRTHRLRADDAIIEFEARWPAGSAPAETSNWALTLFVAVRTPGMQARSWVRTSPATMQEFRTTLATLAAGASGEALLDGLRVPGTAVMLSRRPGAIDAEMSLVGHATDHRFGFRVDHFPVTAAQLQQIDGFFGELLGGLQPAALAHRD